MCFLSTTFPNAPAHPPPPILFDQSLNQLIILPYFNKETFISIMEGGKALSLYAHGL